MKRLIPVALLLVILFGSAGTAAAGTNSADSSAWSCLNISKIGVGTVQICTVDVDFNKVITIAGSANLTHTELDVLMQGLNGIDVLTASRIEVVDTILDIYNNALGIPLLPENLIVVGFPCPC